MSKKSKRKDAAVQAASMATAETLPARMENAAGSPPVQNGLAEAVGFGFGGFPQGQGSPFSEPISDSATIFKNLRWYLVSNFRQVLSEAYVELGLVQTIVDIPVDDALRGGLDIKSKQLDESQVEELQISIDRDDDLAIIGQAMKWCRLFGGAGIIVLTDQDPEEPLNLEAIGPDDRLEFRAVDMWELFYNKQNTEGTDLSGEDERFEHYNYYGKQIHKSRVMKLKGLTAPSFIRPRLRGWGFSVVEILVRSINQYLKATDLGFQVLDEFKLDVYKIKNLVNTLLSPNGQQAIQKRVQLANWQKNYQNAIVMDSEDDFDHKQLSFAGLAEAMNGIRMQVASDMRMPLTKLFGISAAGFNSGEDDIEVYNGMIEGQIRGKVKYPALRLVEIKCQKLFGFIPDDLSVDFKPLRVLSAEQEENVKTQKFARVFQARQAGELTTMEFRDACNKGQLFDVPLDTTDDGLSAVDPELGDVAEDGGDEDTQAPKAPGAAPKSSTAPKDTKDAPAAKVAKNQIGVAFMPVPYTRIERAGRAVTNSAAFDKASYAADGGDDWIDPRRKEFFANPGNVDEGLWAKAREASQAALGEVRWQFVTWWYKKQGGKFG